MDEHILTPEEVERLLEGTTPGPWNFTRKTYKPYWATINCESGHVADVQFWRYGLSENDVQSEANARLIAAAPQIAADYLTLRAERDRLLAERERLVQFVLDQAEVETNESFYPGVILVAFDAQQERT